jgi:hypothetical protein
MSHAHGEVIAGGKKVAFYEYDGTADFAISCLHDSPEDVNTEWRNHPFKECKCGQPPIDVILYSDYGGGFYWNAKACLPCRAIVSGIIPFEEDTPITDGHPLGEPHWSEKPCLIHGR